jgi:hypothetical protein
MQKPPHYFMEAVKMSSIEHEARGGGEAVAAIVRDLCELDPADPYAPETVCVRVADLQRVVERHAHPTPAALDAEDGHG